MSPTVPSQRLPESTLELLAAFGAEESDLYRAMASNPALLELWIRAAWGLRNEASTDRAVRELMILLSAHRHSASYQWADHAKMARDAGVSDQKIEAISAWKSADVFDGAEKAALALMDGMIEASVADETLDSLEKHFDEAERVELILTAGFYCMVPRVLEAFRLEG